MKKIIIIFGIIAIISTTAYSFRGFISPGMCRNNNYRTGYHRMSNTNNWGRKHHNPSYKTSKEYSFETNNIYLEIQRELLNDEPNWKKIEKWNEEIAILNAKEKTEIMKNNH